MLKLKSRVAGFTFTELLITLVLNAVLLIGLVAFMLTVISHYRQTLYANKLNEQLDTVMNIMAQDIRRAGYWGNASSDLGTRQNNNPFMASGADITVSGSCILFTYDRDGNGTLPSISSSSDDERYGFRLTNQAVQSRPPGAAYDCGAASSAWENITDTRIIQITALTFTLNTSTITTGPGTRGISLRSVDITLTGRLASDTSITKTLTMHVRIRNGKYIP